MSKSGEAQGRVTHKVLHMSFQDSDGHGAADSHGGQAAAPRTERLRLLPLFSCSSSWAEIPPNSDSQEIMQWEEGEEGEAGFCSPLTLAQAAGLWVFPDSCLRDKELEASECSKESDKIKYLCTVSSQILNCYWKPWHPEWETSQNGACGIPFS